MESTAPKSISVEQAVARIVNMLHIPAGFTLLEMLSAFEEEAEVNLENADPNRWLPDEIEDLEVRLQACRARRIFAEALQEDLQNQIENVKLGKQSLITLSKEEAHPETLTCLSLAHWASIEHALEIPEWQPSEEKFTWDKVTIKILANKKISFTHKKGSITTKSLSDIGLLNRRDNSPNKQWGVLIGLAAGLKFPEGKKPTGADKTSLSKLRTSLAALTQLNNDPFFQLTADKGWKPRFQLLDNRTAADKRAEDKAILVPYDDNQNYSPEGDDADAFIKQSLQRDP
jgi:hypothetical protein